MPKDIKELLATGEAADIIQELRLGRMNAAPATAATTAQWDPSLHAVNDRRLRPDKVVITEREDPQYGETYPLQPGSDLADDKSIRIEPVARVALALQKLIVKRAVAFTFGNPVAYTSATQDAAEQDVLGAVRRILHDVKEQALNRKAARALYAATEVAEMWYPVECEEHATYGFPCRFKFRCALFSPLLGDRLYPYFDQQRDLVAFSREFTRKDTDLVTRTYFETYTAEASYIQGAPTY